MPKPELTPFIPRIVNALKNAGISSKVDSVQSIGRRYARTDEIGIPFGITIDYTTCQDDTVTLRNRDKTSQVRVKIDEIGELVSSLINLKTTWQQVEEKYPKEEAKVDKE
jgi:glycyl-tRNA synthetase